MAETTKQHLGQRIQEVRRKAGLKQEFIAEKVGIDAKSLSRIEGGTRFPSMETLERIGQILNVPLKEFFEFPGEPASPTEMRRYLMELSITLDDAALGKVVNAIKDALDE